MSENKQVHEVLSGRKPSSLLLSLEELHRQTMRAHHAGYPASQATSPRVTMGRMWGSLGTLPKEFTPKPGDDYGCQAFLKMRQPIFLDIFVNDLKGSTHSMPMTWVTATPGKAEQGPKILSADGRVD